MYDAGIISAAQTVEHYEIAVSAVNVQANEKVEGA